MPSVCSGVGSSVRSFDLLAMEKTGSAVRLPSEFESLETSSMHQYGRWGDLRQYYRLGSM